MTSCLNPLCQIPILSPSGSGRGLCRHCYAEARSLVLRGLTTWGILADAGLILPATHKGRGPNQSLLYDALCAFLQSFPNIQSRSV